jgi:hypothetical protein
VCFVSTRATVGYAASSEAILDCAFYGLVLFNNNSVFNRNNGFVDTRTFNTYIHVSSKVTCQWIEHIFRHCTPTKIAYVIVSSVPVQMVYQWLVLWVLNERFRYKTMNQRELSIAEIC